MEQWKQIPGFEGIYEASSHGRIRSVPRIDPAGRRQPSVLRKPQTSKRGRYLVVNLRKDRKAYMKKVHHLVALAFIGTPPLPFWPGSGPMEGFCEVNHKDGDKTNNKPTNLEYCTRLHNIRHSYAIGLREGSSAGEKNGRAKLTSRQVSKIRKLYAKGNTSIPKLAKQFNVGKSTIGYIVQGVTWKT